MPNTLFSQDITVSDTDSTIFCTQGEFSVIGVYIPTGFQTGNVTFKTSMDAVYSPPGTINASPTMAAVLDEFGDAVTLVAGTAARFYSLPQMVQGNFLQLICPAQGGSRTLKLLVRRID